MLFRILWISKTKQMIKPKCLPLLFVFLLGLIFLTYSCDRNKKNNFDAEEPTAPHPTPNAVPITPDSTKYSTSPPSSFKPAEIDSSSADSQISSTGRTNEFGFSRVFFGNTDIKGMLNQKDAVGIRFYLANKNTSSKVGTLIGIPVDTNRKELYGTNSQYIMSEGVTSIGVPSSQKLTKQVAKKYVANAETVFSEAFFVYMDSTTIATILAKNQVGINFIPGKMKMNYKAGNAIKTKDFKSLSAVPATIKNNRPIDYNVPKGGKNYFESKMPCPPDCGPQGGILP
jgi:hypothetical protein